MKLANFKKYMKIGLSIFAGVGVMVLMVWLLILAVGWMIRPAAKTAELSVTERLVAKEKENEQLKAELQAERDKVARTPPPMARLDTVPSPAPGKRFIGGGQMSVDPKVMQVKEIDVITKDNGSQRVKAVVDEKGLPIVAMPNQPPPVTFNGEECIPCPISTETPGNRPVFTPIWVMIQH